MGNSLLWRIRFNLLLKTILAALMGLFVVAILLELNKNFHFSEKLKIYFDKQIMGHRIEFPSMSNVLILTFFIYIIMSVSTIVFYQSYSKYRYEKEKLKNNITPKKKLNKWALILMLLYFPTAEIIGLISDELSNAFKTSLSDVSPSTAYFWTVYAIIFGTIILGNLLNIGRIFFMNNIKFRNSKTIKDESALGTRGEVVSILKTLLLLGVLSLVIIAASFGISQAPEFIHLEWAPTVLGQRIELSVTKIICY